MFTSELPITLEIPEGEEPQIIHYVNALPGAGKTWCFDNRIAKPHVTEEHNSLLVYAAPTAKLLQERERALLDLGVEASKIMVVTSDSVGNGTTVAEAFREAVTGKAGKKGLPNGTIVLCTHECIARVPHSMRGKDRVVLVYDEARACLQDNYALHLPDDVYSFLIEPREHHTEDGRTIRTRLLYPVAISESSSGDESESVYIWKWSNYGIPLPTNSRLQELLPKSTRQRARAEGILDFLRNIHSSSLDVYVSVTRKARTSEYVVSNVFSPSRMFRGYGKVLILSAFFESSQMFQFLERSERLDGSRTTMSDITKSFISKTRMKLLLKRMARARLTYIYDLGKRTLSKSDMQQALVLGSPLAPEAIKKINLRWRELYPVKPEFYRTVHTAYEENIDRARRMTDDDREPAYKLMRILDERLRILGGVIPHMVESAVLLQQAFLTHLKMPIETLPVGINPRYTSYASGEGTVWATERLDDINKQTKRFKVPKRGDIITQLPITAHGLNAYRDLHSCAFLAAMKYSPREAKFMDRALPEYDTEIDRTLDYALQLLWRCNVRMPTNDPVLLIVTDKHLALRLQQRFRELADYWLGDHELKLLPIVAPQRLVKTHGKPSLLRYSFNSSESQKQRDSTYRTSVKGLEAADLKKEYLKTPDGLRYNQLTAAISYAKKKGQAFAEMKAERDTLMTFSVWRKSPQGILVRTKKFDKANAARDALQRLDANKLGSRNEVLKIVSVIKREAPELKDAVKAWYPGDRFEHNWDTAQDYGKRYNLGWLFKMATDHPSK